MIVHSKQQTLTNIAKLEEDMFEWNYENSEREEEILQFKMNPMLAMYVLTIKGNVNQKYTLDFSDVFDEEKLLKFNAPGIRNKKHIDEVLDYFTTDLATQKLLGHTLTQWQEELGVFIKMSSENICKRKHLAMFCKLPWFYKEENEFRKLCDQYVSAPEPGRYSDYKQFNTELKPVTTIKHHNRQAKQKEFYYLTDRKGRLYEYCDRKNTTTKSIIFSLWKDFQPVDIIAKPKNRPTYDKNWYYTENFSIKST